MFMCVIKQHVTQTFGRWRHNFTLPWPWH